MKEKKQTELFNSFCEPKQICDACFKIVPLETEKTNVLLLCERCKANYINNLEVF